MCQEQVMSILIKNKGRKLTATEIEKSLKNTEESISKNSVVVSCRGLVKYGFIKCSVTGWNKMKYYID
jgi:hypothetical protein